MAELSVEADRGAADILSYDGLQLDWVPWNGDLHRDGGPKKVCRSGLSSVLWNKDITLTVGDQVTLCGSTVEITGIMTSNPLSNNKWTGGNVILIGSEETFIRLTGGPLQHCQCLDGSERI